MGMQPKIRFIGNLGRDPEMRFTGIGVPYTTFSVAVNWKQSEEEHTAWFRVTCWRGLAEITNEYLAKGSLVFIAGRFKVGTYDDADGNTRYSLDVSADEMQMLDKKSEGPTRKSVPASASDSAVPPEAVATAGVGGGDEAAPSW